MLNTIYGDMSSLYQSLLSFLGMAGGKILLAILVFLIGRFLIQKLARLTERLLPSATMDPTVRGFLKNAVEILLYIILAISVISILGVPMASVITVLASAGVAVGLSLQGALSNLAGGIMLLLFRPFSVGNYINTAGGEGTVQSITLFYTILDTVDNRRITIPNGSLMNANVVNFSSQPTRRLDLNFVLRRGSDIEGVKQVLLRTMQANPHVLSTQAPFAGLTAVSENAETFTARAWVKTEDYWTVFSELFEGINTALEAEGYLPPVQKILTENAR